MESQEPDSIPPTKEKVKKPLSDKKLTALKKARAVLVKSRDENRVKLHEDALDGIIEKRLNEKLLKMKLEPTPQIIASTPAPVAPAPPPKHKQDIDTEEEEIIEIRKKKKPVKKIIYVSSSESSEEERIVKSKKAPVKKAPIKKVKEPEYYEIQKPPPTQQELYNNYLYQNLFRR